MPNPDICKQCQQMQSRNAKQPPNKNSKSKLSPTDLKRTYCTKECKNQQNKKRTEPWRIHITNSYHVEKEHTCRIHTMKTIHKFVQNPSALYLATTTTMAIKKNTTSTWPLSPSQNHLRCMVHMPQPDILVDCCRIVEILHQLVGPNMM